MRILASIGREAPDAPRENELSGAVPRRSLPAVERPEYGGLSTGSVVGLSEGPRYRRFLASLSEQAGFERIGSVGSGTVEPNVEPVRGVSTAVRPDGRAEDTEMHEENIEWAGYSFLRPPMEVLGTGSGAKDAGRT